MYNLLKFIFAVCLFSVFSSSLLAKNSITPWWQEQMSGIEQQFLLMENAYKSGDKARALKAAKTAHFTYYKNSDLETAIGRNYKIGPVINLDFLALSRILLKQGDQISAIHQQVELITKNIKKTLPGLPLTDKLKERFADTISQRETEELESKDYSSDTAALKTALQNTLNEYKKADQKAALILLQNAYFTHWQSSGLEKSIETGYRQKIANSFSNLFKEIQQSGSLESVSKRIDSLKKQLQENTLHKLKQGLNWAKWGKYLGSLLILVFMVVGLRKLMAKDY